jgi:hypothetical protein
MVPELYIDCHNQVYCDWEASSRAYDMQIVMVYTMTMFDCNAQWVPGRDMWASREDYMKLLATKVAIRCGNDPRWRASYSITPDLVGTIVSSVEKAYRSVLFQNCDTSLRPENTPRCPSCSSYLQLQWTNYGYYRKALMWQCPSYRVLNCHDNMVKLWGEKPCPPIVTKEGVYFHNWELDGYPVPYDLLIQPLTIWSLTGHYGAMGGEGVYMPKIKKEAKTGRGNKAMTEEQEALLRDTYTEFGPSMVLLKYPGAKLGWDAVCKRAAAMGLKQRPGSPGKRIKKLIA